MTRISRAAILVVIALTSGCSYLTSSLTHNFEDHLSSAILDSNDPAMVAQALPSYLLTLDALLKDSHSANLFWSAAKLNSAYAGQFVNDPVQKQRLADKAWNYAQKATCLEDGRWCPSGETNLVSWPAAELGTLLDKMDRQQVSAIYTLGSVWAGWLEAHHDDWNAVAQLGKIEMLMHRVVVLDENHELGSAHVYLGVLATLMPAALGGRPEEGKQHFERAIELSKGRNLMAKVLYAECYARLVFDRDLHDRLLNEVMTADATESHWTLANTLAQQKAQQLLKSGEEYF
jgi:hypothetical protein